MISTWASGTGGAGLFGSLTYAGLIYLGVTPMYTILMLLAVPAIEAFTFWILLRRPEHPHCTVNRKSSTLDDAFNLGSANSTNNENWISMETDEIVLFSDEDIKPLVGFKEHLVYMKKLLKYIFPLMSVYFAEYFINQGLVSHFLRLELIFF